MSDPIISVLTLIFGIGKFEDDEDYQRVFVVKPSPILFPTRFVKVEGERDAKLDLEIKIDLQDMQLFNRFNAVDVSYPWADTDAFIKLNLTGTIDVDGNVIAEHNVVPTPGALIFDTQRIGLVSWQLNAQSTIKRKIVR